MTHPAYLRMHELAAELHEWLPAEKWHVAVVGVLKTATDRKGVIIVADAPEAIRVPLNDAIVSQLPLDETGGARRLSDGQLGCLDCAERYGSPRFPDLRIADDAWRAIAPKNDEGGLLCPNCISARLEAKGLERVRARFTSGAMVAPSTNVSIFVVYDHPRDYPSSIVVRRWCNEKPDWGVRLFSSLGEAREALASAGLSSIGRMPGDDKAIVEVWL